MLNNISKNIKYYDSIVVGSGLIGGAVAASLATKLGDGARIALVEAHAPRRLEPIQELPELRTTALNARSVRMLEESGVWERIQKVRAPTPYDSMHVWDALGDASVTFRAAEIGAEQLGFIVENRHVQAALHERVQELPNVVLHCPATIERIESSPLPDDAEAAAGADWARVRLSDGDELRARLLIACDGANSVVRRQLGIATHGWSYAQRAMVATVRTDTPTRTAWQRFLPDGPIALLPLFDSYHSLVWSVPERHAAAYRRLDNERFGAAVQRAFTDVVEQRSSLHTAKEFVDVIGHHLSAQFFGAQRSESEARGGGTAANNVMEAPRVVEVVGERGDFPLVYRNADAYVAHRVALVGDAAHTVHPMAGLGANLGYGDADALLSHLVSARRFGAELGELGVLRDYEAERRSQVQATALTIDSLWRLFTQSHPLLSAARHLGLSGVNNVAALRTLIMEAAINT